MLSCFLKRVVPFALAFLFGLGVWQLLNARLEVANDILYFEYGPKDRSDGRGTRYRNSFEGEQSRTWLIVRSTPLRRAKVGGRECDGCSVRMRVLFGEDGAVPGNGFSLSPSSYPLVEDAVAAARSIVFTPATKNGRPIPIWANVTYSCGAEFVKPHAPHAVEGCVLSIEKDSARTWDGKPWRVVTLYE